MLRRLVIGFYVVALLTLVIGPSVGPAAATGPAPQPPGDASLAAPSPTPSTRIVQENQRPGTMTWQSAELSRGRGTPYQEEEPRPAARNATPLGAAPPSEPWVDTVIHGYAGRDCVNCGDAVTLHVGTSRPRYDLEVYRIGWYGGSGARLLHVALGLAGQNQPVPTPEPQTGLIAANWQVSYTLQTGADWVSGVYLVKLIADSGDVG